MLIATVLFPLASFAQTFTRIATAVGNNKQLQVIALSSAGAPYLPVFLNTSGTWQTAGELPTSSENPPFSALVTGEGHQDTNEAVPQVIGLGTDGYAYLADYQDSSGTWHAGGLLPGGNITTFKQLLTGVGNSGNLQVIGLGTNGLAYIVAYQSSSNGTWYSGGELPGQGTVFSSLVTGQGQGSGGLQVIGIGTNGAIYLTAFQDQNSGTWQSAGQLYSSATPTALATANGNGNNLQVIGLSQSNRFLYLEDWQNGNGTWNGAGELPGQGTALSAIVTGVGNGNLQVGGLGASDQLLHMTSWLSGGGSGAGTWYALTPIAQYNVPVTQLVSGNGIDSHGYGTLNILGLGTNGHIELITFQNHNNTWIAGGDLTTTSITE
jgi:hypothetical protein